MTKAAKTPTASAAQAASTRKSLEDFKRAHDKSFIVPSKIRAALKGLGPRGWAYEVEFIRLCGLSTTDLAAYRDQFEEHLVLVDRIKRVWAGSPAFAAELRKMATS